MDTKSQAYNKEFIKDLAPDKFSLKLKVCQASLAEAREAKQKLLDEKRKQEENYALPHELELTDERIAIEDNIISDLEGMLELFCAIGKKRKLL